MARGRPADRLGAAVSAPGGDGAASRTRAARPLARRRRDPRVRVCELCWGQAATPQVLAVLTLVYPFVAAGRHGRLRRRAWSRRGDAFGVYFGAVRDAVAVRRREDGRLALRPPVTGATAAGARAGRSRCCVSRSARPSSTAPRRGRCSTAIGPNCRTSSRRSGCPRALGWSWPSWSDCSSHRTSAPCRSAHLRIRERAPAGRALGAQPAIRAHADPDRRRLRRRPLLLAARLQRPGPVAAGVRPARRRAPTCSAAPCTIDYGVVSATAIWYVQVGALVVGHVAGLVLAHDRALVVYGSAKAATRSQIVMLILMVCSPASGSACCRSRERIVQVLVIAHAGHWLVQLTYLVPLVVARREDPRRAGGTAGRRTTSRFVRRGASRESPPSSRGRASTPATNCSPSGASPAPRPTWPTTPGARRPANAYAAYRAADDRADAAEDALSASAAGVLRRRPIEVIAVTTARPVRVGRVRPGRLPPTGPE